MKYKMKAFTLIELLVVIVIVGILATISTATYSGALEKARLGKAQFAAGQVKKQFLAENAASGTNVFTGWYGFDKAGDVNTSSPYILDKSEAGNHLTSRSGSNYSQDSDTGSGSGQSLRIINRYITRPGTVPGGPTDKLTLALWVKMNSMGGSHTFPMFLTSSTGFNIGTDRKVRFYMNGSTSNDVESKAGVMKDGEWHYLVGSYNGDTDTLSLWVDGDLVGTRTLTQTVPFQGRGIYLGYGNFNGWVDEAMVFPFAFDGEGLN